ncbi:Rhodanese-related sulfurtransferase [Acidisarcina polymorpha]|uniref:Rhodanese-related sulfurtransferase n=2 Tax=Acidisarcina polymorpha TaxID=2211140 RepID=A0A2Z5FYB0_9BACT|nr:Rhodanese-related sulfurtransferase [Acidisarcina polymorpha]
MVLALSIIGVVALIALFLALCIKAFRERRELERHSITAESLHAMLAANQPVLLYDVRQPLDLLTDSDIIPGAQRISPRDIVENPSLIPKDKDAVVYCTCPSDKTSKAISQRAKALHFLRVRFLKGGLAAWKREGYPVERYKESFHLDTAT